MKPQKAKKVAIKYDSYRVVYLFMDVAVLPGFFCMFQTSL